MIIGSKRLVVVLMVAACQSQPSHERIPAGEPQAYDLTGQPLYAVARSPDQHEKLQQQWQEAYDNYRQDPEDLEYIIWYGRRTAYLQQYREAVDIFTRGLEVHPRSPQLLRHRGHRYITLRKFDQAIQDLEQAAGLMDTTELEVEPDGLPNKFNIPLSNTQFNILYHLGLAHYLKGDYNQAGETYQACLDWCNNDDLLVATVDWYYMCLRRMGHDVPAMEILEQVHENMRILENDSYYRRLLMYKGMIPPDSLLQVTPGSEDYSLTLATQGYGVGNWYYNNGDKEKARRIFESVINTGNWAAFGYIAAEVDLHKMGE